MSAAIIEIYVYITNTIAMTSLVAHIIVLRQITVPETVLYTTKPKVSTAGPQQICVQIVSTLIDVYVDCMLLFEH
jgi:hypothetical protein